MSREGGVSGRSWSRRYAVVRRWVRESWVVVVVIDSTEVDVVCSAESVGVGVDEIVRSELRSTLHLCG